MIVEGRFSIDTNILVYAADQTDEDRHEISEGLVNQSSSLDCVRTFQALGEFFHAATRKRLLTEEKAAAFVNEWLGTFTFARVGKTLFPDAMRACGEHKVSFWDAMLLAATRRAGCSAVISENMQHGWRLDGVEIINPFAADAAARLRPLGLSVRQRPAGG